jgi:GDP-D-mannose dehydratase
LAPALVTYAAGSGGSYLSAHLINEGFDVLDVGCFTVHHGAPLNRLNIGSPVSERHFDLLEIDLALSNPPELAEKVDVRATRVAPALRELTSAMPMRSFAGGGLNLG